MFGKKGIISIAILFVALLSAGAAIAAESCGPVNFEEPKFHILPIGPIVPANPEVTPTPAITPVPSFTSAPDTIPAPTPVPSFDGSKKNTGKTVDEIKKTFVSKLKRLSKPSIGSGGWGKETDKRAPVTDLEKYAFAQILNESGNPLAVERANELLDRLSQDYGRGDINGVHQEMQAKKNQWMNNTDFAKKWPAREKQIRSYAKDYIALLAAISQ